MRANELRALRALKKVGMKRGREDIKALLFDPPPWLEGMRVDEFVRSTPKVGPVKTHRVLRDCRLRPTDRVGKIPLAIRCFLYSLLPR